MIGPSLSHPEWQGAALAVVAVASGALLAARAIARRRRMRLVGTPVATPAPRSPWVSDLALLVALCAILVALLGPRLGERVVRLPGDGVDVAILMDVSRSMDARDVPPSRLDRARRIAAEVLDRLDPRDRVALAAFADRGVLLAPLTPDRAALAELLAALDTRLIHPAASDLGAGVRAALQAFEDGSDRPRVLLVLGDGEDPEGRDDDPTAALVGMDVRVVASAIGSEAGSTIPDAGGALRDRDGNVVVSHRRASRFERITSASSGALFLADGWGRIDVDALIEALRRDAGARPGEPVLRRVAAVRVAPFAALAFALLLCEGLPRIRLGRRLGLALVVLSLALAGASPGPPSAGSSAPGGRDPRSLVWLGLDRLERGERDGAARAFEAAAVTAGEPSLAALAYYDLAVAQLARGELEAARDAFLDALALAPGDERARFDLEWTLRALAAAPPPSPSPEPSASEPEPRPSEPEPERDRPTRTPDTGEDRPPIPASAVDSPAPAGAPSAPTGPRRATPPDPALRERWMARVRDDLPRALQAATREPGRPRAAGPAW